MYQFSDETVKAAFLEAVEAGNVQHIRGQLSYSGGSTPIGPDDLLSAGYEKQCVTDADTFGIGQLYTGTVEIEIACSRLRYAYIAGGTLRLEFGMTLASGAIEYIPIGQWTVTDPERSAEGILTVRGVDCISKLDVPITDSYVGVVYMSGMMRRVTELTGVEFAQTAQELIGGDDEPYGSSFPATCRAVVSAIAEYIGGIAFADRYGRIAFRRLSSAPVLTIPANLRHSIRLGEYSCGIRGLKYSDRYGYIYSYDDSADDEHWNTGTVGAALAPVLSESPFIWESLDEASRDRQYHYCLRHTAAGLRQLPDWVPGEIDYYGNPALDLGDVVQVTGGITGQDSVLFLITSDSWQFRGPQRFTSAGAGETGLSGSSGSSTSSVITTINLTKSLTAIPLLSYEGELFPRLRTVARGGFAVRSETVVFVELTANLTGEGGIRLHVLYDGVKQTVHSRETVPERSTVSYSVQLTAQQGIHTIEVEAAGEADLERITALVWGQDITAVQPEYSSESDYEYTVSAGAATVDKYIGRGTMPQIPDTLGGAPVRVIGSSSFTDSDVECVYIPDGVEEIE